MRKRKRNEESFLRLFECDEAKQFWKQIGKMFPEYESRTQSERLLFVQRGTKPCSQEQRKQDDAVATALVMRWKERAKASLSRDHAYDPDAVWKNWGAEMYLKHHHGKDSPAFLYPLPILIPESPGPSEEESQENTDLEGRKDNVGGTPPQPGDTSSFFW